MNKLTQFILLFSCALLFAESGDVTVTMDSLSSYRDSIPTDTLLVDSESHGITLRSRNLDLHTALGLITEVSGFRLRIDTVVSGSVTAEIINSTLPEALDQILTPAGLAWRIEQDLVIIEGPETGLPDQNVVFKVIGNDIYRIFTINYPRLNRKGAGVSTAQISTNASGEVGAVQVTSEDEIKFWDELNAELSMMISDDAVLSMNRTAGTIYLKEDPEILDMVQQYLSLVVPAITRQVEITARIYEVTLNDDNALGIDWNSINGTIPVGNHNIDINGSMNSIQNDPSLRNNVSDFNVSAFDGDLSIVIQALAEQGSVQAVSQPRVVTLNNQPAMVKVGTDLPYFSVTSETDDNGNRTYTEEVITVTVGVVLSLTPQVSENGWITLGIDPVITDLVNTVSSTYGSTAPVIDIKQSSSVVRLEDNETIRISGLIHTKESEIQRRVPVLSRIPILGHLFQWNYQQSERKELVIFITPRVI